MTTMITSSIIALYLLMLGQLMYGGADDVAPSSTSIVTVTDTSEKSKPVSRWNSTNIILYIMCHDEDSCRIAQHASTLYPTITKISLLPHTVFFETAIYREFLFYNFAEWKDKEYVGAIID
jgi:hypothetical protein